MSSTRRIPTQTETIANCRPRSTSGRSLGGGETTPVGERFPLKLRPAAETLLLGLRQGLDGSGQAALVASGLVLVDDPLIGDAVYHAGGGPQHGLGGAFISRFDSLFHLLDRRAQRGAQACVVRARLFGLAGTPLRLFRNGHR